MIESDDSPQRSQKRKRDTNDDAEEIEIDINLPEPPSKKALRRAKKGKPIQSEADKPSFNDTSDLLEDGDDDGDVTASKNADDNPATSTTEPKRAEFGIWIGNLPFFCTPSALKTFICTHASIEPDTITRVHLPLTNRPLLPWQIQRNKDEEATANPSSTSSTPQKFQNKGFAYVDFTTAAALFQALQVSEKELAGRKVLIKDAKSFAGRPEKTTPSATPSTNEVENTKPKSKRVFIGNLPFDADREVIEGHFSQAGEVEDVFVAQFEDSGKCKGFAWVRFTDEDAAERAVKGWVWKVDSREGHNGDEKDEEDEEEEEGDEKKENETKEQGKKRKWWINKLNGRLLRCEFAEDASVRYKKRFGKGASQKTNGENRDGGRTDDVENVEFNADDKPQSAKKRAPRGATEEERIEFRRKKHSDARRIAPGKALAGAPRASEAIVQSTGSRKTFD